ncbi:unnamed protein product [Rotaria magnacalcarata]|uniref:Uncharacterized protein n=1 Tax=Rotaria magnacalcarata TaxID=392030 RepID=A0A816R8W6_9BILA|nr:unnamed protein product [Rotaria magnacalcarata]
MLVHATADIVSRSIIDSLKSDGVDITKMLMLERDNPNVNKAIEDILHKEVVAERKKNELTKSLPLKNDFLRHLQYLQPFPRQRESFRTSITYLSRHVPYLLTNEEVDRVGVGWCVYQMADIPEEWFRKTTVSSDQIIEYLPIDKYWYRIFSTATSIGTPQYVVLTKLVKYLLYLSHGNSDSRGFSENNHLVPDDRSSLNEASINGLRATKAAVKFFGGGKVHAVPATSTLISKVKDAYSRYTKDNEQQQKLIKKEETQLINEQKTLQEELTKATNMLEEGTTRLAAAMKNKKFDDIGTAEVLVTAANAKLIKNNENLNRLRKKEN